MYEILVKKSIAEKEKLIEIYAPEIAKKSKAGQFVILLTHEKGERIPLTIADWNTEKGTVTIVFQEVGKSTTFLGAMEAGDRLYAVVGPMGYPSHVEKFGTVVCVGGGVGIAAVYPIARALKEYSNEVISIIGVRTKDLLIFEKEMESVSDSLLIATDDGSYGTKGFVTDILKSLIEDGTKIDRVIGVGPVMMMKFLAKTTQPYGIKTMVSLNPIMIDATGMCGGCRVNIGGETKFTCVDGPEFDGHLVNFDELIKRQRMYIAMETYAKQSGMIRNSCRRQTLKLEGEVLISEKRKLESDEVLSNDSTDTRKGSKKIQIPRQKMLEREPQERIKNFNEVALGYDEKLAVFEALRCLNCKRPRCVEGCPVRIDIPAFLKLIVKRDFIGAARKIKEANSLPAICGRVCPQEAQCEKECVLGRKDEPVAIGNLERFVADYEREHNAVEIPLLKEPTGKRVAVVGSGPAGLTAASELAKMGHKVKIFEALHKPGGVLLYGIPEFRMPKKVLEAEIKYLKKLGVEIETNAPVGMLYDIDELLDGEFDAVFVATGAGAPHLLDIEGENLLGIYSANEFLTRVNLMGAYRFPEYDTPVIVGEKVAVIGAGNTAMDAARSALRFGTREVSIVYRRTRQEMPAREAEIEHAIEEGVKFITLTAPTEFLGDDEGWVKTMKCIRMKPGEPDESGRRRPIPIEGSEFEMPVDTVINA
ncbi:MAG: NADPH-dependent glutamate synthase, partial [Candidatus Poribacteria bacterium]